MKIRFLGTHNLESKDTRLSCLLIDDIIAVDAGSFTSELTFTEQAGIKAILLSHGHYDHIRAIPAFALSHTDRSIPVFGTDQTLEIVATHLLDGTLYPELASEKSFAGRPVIQLHPLQYDQPRLIEGFKVTAIPVQHPLHGAGLEIESSQGKRLFYTGDTGPGLSTTWEKISPDLLIVDVTFPNALKEVARESGHLCPELLHGELKEFRRIKGYIPQITIIHMEPRLENQIAAEIRDVANDLGISIGISREKDSLVL